MKTLIYENIPHFYTLWRATCLQKQGAEKREAEFIIKTFKNHPASIKTVIDLGGGVGVHSNILAKKGYDVTLFDQSKKALQIAKKTNSKIKIEHGSFETINLKSQYDAAICMWSTLSYIFNEKGRKHFYDWQKTHIKHLIILDEPNFYQYSHKFHKLYQGENKEFKMNVIRDWILSKKYLKKTKFVYEIFDKKKKSTSIVKDAENQQYVTVKQLEKYLGKKWQLKYVVGDYALNAPYNKNNSSRIITIFYKND